jgi:hypothetical protein
MPRGAIRCNGIFASFFEARVAGRAGWTRCRRPGCAGARRRVPARVPRTTRAASLISRSASGGRPAGASPEPLVQPRSDLFPRDRRFGGAVVLDQAALHLCPLRIGERQRLGFSRDTVPEVLGQLDALGDAQLEQLIERKVRHAPRLPAHRCRVNQCYAVSRSCP